MNTPYINTDTYLFQCLHCGWVFSAAGKIRQDTSNNYLGGEYRIATCPHCWQDVIVKV